MVQFLFVLAAVGGGSAVELMRLGGQKRTKEIVVYIVLSAAALTLLGLIIFWKDMPSLYAILSGQYEH